MAQEKVIVTRPMPQAEATAARVAALGFTPVIAPVMTYAARKAIVAEDVDGLVFTSAAGVRFGAPQIKRRDLPVWCVGDATARAARRAGFAEVKVGPGDAAGLSGLLPSGRTLLHLCGTEHRDVAGTLSVMVYNAVEVTALPNGVLEADIHAVLLHSPRTARIFCGLARQRRPRFAVCLSAAVADSVDDAMRCIVAARPTEQELLAALASTMTAGD